jgi:hypothetical protein
MAGLAVDVADPGAVGQIVKQAGACFGGIDAVIDDCITSGPASITGRIEETDPQAYAGCSAPRTPASSHPESRGRGGSRRTVSH